MNNWLTSKFDHQKFDGQYDGYIGVYAGLTYRFKNHDGSRDFHHEMYNASRYDYLNDQANKLRAQAEAKRNGAPIINVQKKVVEGNLIRTLISFEDGKSSINKLQEVNVYTAAEDYKKLNDATIYIMPYGDNRPTDVELFVQRANTVKDQLMNQYNVPAGRINIESNPQIIKNLTEQNAVVVFINE
jgi:outer membrane protein OmpA-like peptidoglycan-associated protein